MAEPRVFISSTFYDLKHIRNSLELFIENLGYEAVLSEKGAIAYNPDHPLDESCYKEVILCDVFILIIGGRYGSPASDQETEIPLDFYERYESITKREYESAVDHNIPIYILIERDVYQEFEFYKKNKSVKGINYSHVDSVNIFKLIESILTKTRNNPILKFERHTEIQNWLRAQWAGLFQSMLKNRTEFLRLNSLENQVSELSDINITLKTYLEAVLSQVSAKDATKIITDEEKRLLEEKQKQILKNETMVREFLNIFEIDIEGVITIFKKANSFNALADLIEEESGKKFIFDKSNMIQTWSESEEKLELLNNIRKILNLSELGWDVPNLKALKNDKKRTKNPQPTNSADPKRRAAD